MKPPAGAVLGRLAISATSGGRTELAEAEARLGRPVEVGPAVFIPIFDEATCRPLVLVVLPSLPGLNWRRVGREAGAFLLNEGEVATGAQDDPPRSWACRFIPGAISLEGSGARCLLCRAPAATLRIKSRELGLAGAPLCGDCDLATRADGEE